MQGVPSVLIFYSTAIIAYCFYQFIRNYAVYNILMRWVYEDDDRYYKYSYDEMFDPSIKNLFGLIYPKEKHFK